MEDFLVFVGLESANVTYVRAFLSFANLKCPTRKSLFSCLPLKPKCWVTKYQVVFRRTSGVCRPGRLSFHSMSSSFQVSASVSFGRVLLHSCRRVIAFPLRIYQTLRILFHEYLKAYNLCSLNSGPGTLT